MSWLSQELKTTQWRLRQKFLHNFVFVHIPKTGGTSIVRTFSLPREHKMALDLRGRIGSRRWERRFKFAFVRNPWDRAVSSFHFACIRNSRYIALTFSDWLQLAYVERHPLYFDLPHSFSPQFDWISDSLDNVIIDFVGRFENLQQDFATICQRIGRPVTTLPRLNPTEHQEYRYYYKDKDAEIIAQWYKKDIDYFGYAFDRPASLLHTVRTADKTNYPASA